MQQGAVRNGKRHRFHRRFVESPKGRLASDPSPRIPCLFHFTDMVNMLKMVASSPMRMGITFQTTNGPRSFLLSAAGIEIIRRRATYERRQRKWRFILFDSSKPGTEASGMGFPSTSGGTPI